MNSKMAYIQPTIALVVKLKIIILFTLSLSSIFSLPLTFRPRLGGENGMEWKWMKRIILEYFSLPFPSLPFPCLRVLMEGMESPFPYLGV